ncbi:FtsK/SpoIIIE domain-containing protein, partial [Conyzicola sp.]|uniref:FtsK/SpoIIIE domain-containing protein n=1 Tax=Conyzicola sp. TaxID=1969404 RepID=UPI00398996E0
MASEHLRIAAPAPPAPPQPYSFPLMATVAPVVVSLAIWAITQSVFALLFAALGPAVAVASLADARIQSRRRRRRENARFSAELEAARAEVEQAHERERTELAESLPSARRLVLSTWPPSERWLASLDQPVPVGIGAGERASAVQLEGTTSARGRDDAHVALRALVDAVARLPGAPIVLDARLGIGIVGPRVVATATARGVVLQVLASLSPDSHSVAVSTDERAEWAWLGAAPHRTAIVGDDQPRTVVRVVGTGGEIVVGVAERSDLLPSVTRAVVTASGLRSCVEQHPDRSLLGPVRLEQVSREEAVLVARGMAAHASRVGLGDDPLPDRLGFDDCGPRETRADGQPSLAAVVGVTAHGPLSLDLVAHGPHAIVGGTTGSGKSELLTAWVLAIAHDHAPSDASVLLVDFKGGSAFAALERLPHCVGVITDLDEAAAQRALESLAAELRRRERLLAAAGAKSIDTLPSGARLPRLLIVVDEFAAMVSGFPELHAVFADIAARGRSLGVHLVLCTQRPAGVIRDSVLANSALRLSLRVNNRADSAAVIGSDAAASLPVEPRGRAFVAADGDEPVLAQFPLVTQGDIDRVAARWVAYPHRPHRPWLDPLPTEVALDALPAVDRESDPAADPAVRRGGIPFGLLDDPATQSQPVAVYRPTDHGSLLVVGAAGSGKSTLLATLGATAEVQRIAADIEGAWDALVDLLAELRATAEHPRGPRLVLLDDLDALLGRFPEEYESAVLELVTQCLREGPARGIHWAITAQRLTPALHPVVGLCGSRLLLRLPDRQEHVLAGGDGSAFVERLPPGAGRWNGLRLQVAVDRVSRLPERQPGRHSGAQPNRDAPHTLPTIDASAPFAVVSNRPAPGGSRSTKVPPSPPASTCSCRLGSRRRSRLPQRPTTGCRAGVS